jgi:hypothetical protein
MNHGLLYLGSPPPPLEGCERKDLKNPLGGRPSDALHMGAVVGGQDRPVKKTARAPVPVGALFLR